MKKIAIRNADIFTILTFLSALGGCVAAKHGYNKLGISGFVGVFAFLLIGWIMVVIPKKDCMLKCAFCGHERLKSVFKIKRDYLWFGEWLCPVCLNNNLVRSTRLRGSKPAHRKSSRMIYLSLFFFVLAIAGGRISVFLFWFGIISSIISSIVSIAIAGKRELVPWVTCKRCGIQSIAKLRNNNNGASWWKCPACDLDQVFHE